MNRTKPVTLLICLLALLSAGWGYEGHRIVGEIAWHYLTTEAKGVRHAVEHRVHLRRRRRPAHRGARERGIPGVPRGPADLA